MKNLRNLTIILLLVFTGITFAQDGSKAKVEKDKLVWLTDLKEAQKLSEETGKPIMANFTGSDWCGYCIRLKKNVFDKPAFVKWANDNVILLELDFPRFKKLPKNLKLQNQKLQQEFGVRGYPTLWIFFAKEGSTVSDFTYEKIGQLGYPRGGAIGKEEAKFIENANAILKMMKK